MHHTTAPVVMVAANVRHMACSTARSNPPSLIRLAPVEGADRGAWVDESTPIADRMP